MTSAFLIGQIRPTFIITLILWNLEVPGKTAFVAFAFKMMPALRVSPGDAAHSEFKLPISLLQVGSTLCPGSGETIVVGQQSVIEVGGSWNNFETSAQMARNPLTDVFEPACLAALLASGDYEYKFKIFGAWCTDQSIETFPGTSGTSKVHRFTVMHPASNPASEVVAAAVLAAGAAAADTIAGLRAEVALLQAESAHLRALEAARLQAWAADLRAKLTSDSRTYEKGQERLRLDLDQTVAEITHLSRGDSAEASRGVAQQQAGPASSARGADTSSSAAAATGSSISDEGGAGSKRGRGGEGRRGNSGGGALGLPAQAAAAAGGGSCQSSAAPPHAFVRRQIPKASLAAGAAAAAAPQVVVGSQGAGGGEGRASRALASGGSSSAEDVAAPASLPLLGVSCDGLGGVATATASATAAACTTGDAAASLGVSPPPLTGQLDGVAAVGPSAAVRRSSRKADPRVHDSAAPHATGMSDAAGGALVHAERSSASAGAGATADAMSLGASPASTGMGFGPDASGSTGAAVDDWASRLALIADPDAAATYIARAFFERGGFPELVRLLEAAGIRPTAQVEGEGMPCTDVQKILEPLGMYPTYLGRALKQLGVMSFRRWPGGVQVYVYTLASL